MRLVIAAALALATLGAGSANGQAGSSPALNPGELLLEIEATGISHGAADLVTLEIPLVSTAASAAAARAANRGLEQRVAAAARSAGVDAADIRIVPQPGRFGFVGNEAMEVLTAQSGEPRRMEARTLEIRLRDASRFEALRDALEAAGADRVSDPRYSLANDMPARQAAKADAIRRARQEAEAYARTLGMEVGRVLRISERVAASLTDLQGVQEMYRLMLGNNQGATNDIETRVKVSVDFALVAKR